MTTPGARPEGEMEREELINFVRSVAMSLPPSDFGSHRAIEAMADAMLKAGMRRAAQPEVERLREALTEIAAFNNTGANEHLRRFGTYAMFDEPGSVKIARAALEAKR